MNLENFMQIMGCLRKIANGPPKVQNTDDGVTSMNVVKFNYGIGKNIKLAENTPEFKQFQEMSQKKIEGFDEKYKPELMKLYEKHCLKDKDGKPIMLPSGGFTIPPQNRVIYEEDEKKLKEKFSEISSAMEIKQKGLEDLLKTEEIEVEWHKIKLSYFPEWVIGADMSLLIDMIIDDMEE